MGSDYAYSKIYIRKAPQEAKKNLLDWLDEKASANGLQPVHTEKEAHFGFMVITSRKINWLHFSEAGHFLPFRERRQFPLPELISSEWSIVHLSVDDDAAHHLRRIEQTEVVAQYKNYKASVDVFENAAAAEPYNPVFESWEDLLATGITSQQFYQSLPPPKHKDTPTPTFSFPSANLMEQLQILFGWNPELKRAAMMLYDEGNPGRGDFYDPQAGDCEEEESGTITSIRYYAHPNGGEQYPRIAEDMEE